MFILLLLFWIILNGKVTSEILIMGVAIAGFVYWLICKYFDYSIKNDISIFKNTFRIIEYIFVLIWEIVKSSITVINMTFVAAIPVQPQIVFFDVPIKSEFLRVVLANSITITPGTITVDVKDNQFCVHALDYTMTEGIEDSVFIKLLMKMEGGL